MIKKNIEVIDRNRITVGHKILPILCSRSTHWGDHQFEVLDISIGPDIECTAAMIQVIFYACLTGFDDLEFT